jgi:single-stranded-DNA-specific exonuclease
VEPAEPALIPEMVARILRARGMAAEQMAVFLYPDYDRDRHDPALLTDMNPAVARLELAVERGEQVAVYGDYDIDGITATALMAECLESAGLKVRTYIPDRFEEGYGINQAALERLQSEGASLVVSVDCGITSVKEAEWARRHGLDLIITDHHSVPEVIPEAVAVINPKRPGDLYPFKELAGVGVAFKLAMALQQRLGRPAVGQEKWWLDLVALGTVCDVVDLTGENRMLVSYGLKVLRRSRRPGVRALALVGGVDPAALTARQLGFVLGPRMNAAGRLEHAAASLELMLTKSEDRAMMLAGQLDELNRRRRDTQDVVLAAANNQAAGFGQEPVLVLADADWSQGVAGIVAARMVEQWGKPVLVGQILGDSAKGSARSVPGFNMVEALRWNSALLTKFGGHYHAAGFTLPASNLGDLRQGMNNYYREQADVQRQAEVKADVALPDLSRLNLELAADLERLEPLGRGNPAPNFELAGLRVADVSRVGKDGQHLRLDLADGAGRRLGAIGFGRARDHQALDKGQNVTATGILNKNEFRGATSLQLVIDKLRYE